MNDRACRRLADAFRTTDHGRAVDNANDGDFDGVDDAFAKTMKDIVNGQDVDDLVKISGERYPSSTLM